MQENSQKTADLILKESLTKNFIFCAVRVLNWTYLQLEASC